MNNSDKLLILIGVLIIVILSAYINRCRNRITIGVRGGKGDQSDNTNIFKRVAYESAKEDMTHDGLMSDGLFDTIWVDAMYKAIDPHGKKQRTPKKQRKRRND